MEINTQTLVGREQGRRFRHGTADVVAHDVSFTGLRAISEMLASSRIGVRQRFGMAHGHRAGRQSAQRAFAVLTGPSVPAGSAEMIRTSGGPIPRELRRDSRKLTGQRGLRIRPPR